MENKKRTLQKMPPLKIGNVEMPNPLVLAPMAGVTDLPFRVLCKEQGAGLICMEMVSAKAILYKNKNIELTPLFHGGGQEKGLRAGTYNTPLIVGIGKACEIAINELEANRDIIETKSKFLIQEINNIKGSIIIGNENCRVPNIIDVIIPDFDSNIFISKTKNFALSNGSACTSQIIESSHVLKAMGFSDAECSQTIRISINKKITESQIKELVETLKAEIK